MSSTADLKKQLEAKDKHIRELEKQLAEQKELSAKLQHSLDAANAKLKERDSSGHHLEPAGKPPMAGGGVSPVPRRRSTLFDEHSPNPTPPAREIDKPKVNAFPPRQSSVFMMTRTDE